MPILGAFRALVVIGIIAVVVFIIAKRSGIRLGGGSGEGGAFRGYGRRRPNPNGTRTGYTRPNPSSQSDEPYYESPAEIVEVPIIEVSDVDDDANQ